MNRRKHYYTYKDLRNIALGLIRGDIHCDWMNEDTEEICTLSEIEQLILQTEDIGMIFEYARNVGHYSPEKNPIYHTHEKLMMSEALIVAELFLKYRNILDVYAEVVIPHE